MQSLLDNKAAVVAGTAATAYVLYKSLDNSRPSATRTLRAPPSPSLLLGNMDQIVDYDIDLMEEWLKEYGTVFANKGVFSTGQLCIADPKTVAYITSRALEFSKPPALIRAVIHWTGPGLFAAEGEPHKRQRRVLNPAFSIPQLKSLDTIMVQKSHDLKDIWTSRLGETPAGSEPVTLDVLDWLGRATLDIIGEAGFGYQLQTLENAKNELADAFHTLFLSTTALDIIEYLNLLIPGFSNIPLERNRAVHRSLAVMQRIGSQLIEEKKAEIRRLASEGEDPGLLLGRDLLSVLVKNNMKEEEAYKMSEEEVLAQISTFIIAGHETSSTAMAWTLYALSKDHNIQSKLRDELLAIPNENPTWDELNALPYLDLVVKESLRRYGPATVMSRVSLSDVVLPLSEPVIDKEGRTVNEIFVKAGEEMTIWNAALNNSTKWWGPDAHKFRPERFAEPLPAEVAAIPSVFGNLASFGSGTRACIGWRFAITEIKAILFTLIRHFDFDIDPKLVIKTQSIVVARPAVEGEKGTQLPLKVSLHSTKV